MSDSDYCVVFITTDGPAEGKRIADRLLDDKLVACANLVPQITSWFWWQGKIDTAAEALLVCKTKRTALEALGRVVAETHSYEVPEIIAMPILWGSASYLAWIDEQVLP